MNRDQCLTEAKKCVCANREAQYGNPENNFKMIANLWSDYLDDYLDYDLSAEDVACMMILLKIARARNGNFKNDNYVDIAGYSACACELGE